VLHRLAARHRETDAGAGDGGDTLIEVLIAVAVVAATAAALIGAVLTSITASSEHRSLAVDNAVLSSYVETVENAVQRQASPMFTTACGSSYSVAPQSLPAGYNVGITSITYWNGTGFGSTCPASHNNVQLITATATSPTQVSTSVSFVVRNPSP
jgi:type II secretory pathway pseudopilin PulG